MAAKTHPYKQNESLATQYNRLFKQFYDPKKGENFNKRRFERFSIYEPAKLVYSARTVK